MIDFYYVLLKYTQQICRESYMEAANDSFTRERSRSGCSEIYPILVANHILVWFKFRNSGETQACIVLLIADRRFV